MTAPRATVLCSPWATFADVPPADQALATQVEWERWLKVASDILWALTGRRWMGQGCTTTETLRSSPPPPGTGTWPYESSWGSCACWAYGHWLGDKLYPPPDWASRSHQVFPVAVKLSRAPVQTVTEVRVQGVLFAAWRVTRSGWLERTDGKPWQTCGDLTEVTYTYGEPPPEGGVQATVELAKQLLLGSQGSNECKLPNRTTSITRQGVSYELASSTDIVEANQTGLFFVDLWVKSVNPLSRPARGAVWSPDIPQTLRQS